MNVTFRRVGALYTGCAASSLAFSGFPQTAVYAYVLGLMPISLVLQFAIEHVHGESGPAFGPISAGRSFVEPVVLLGVSLVALAAVVVLHFGMRRRDIALAAVEYLAIAFVVAGLYSLLAFLPAIEREVSHDPWAHRVSTGAFSAMFLLQLMGVLIAGPIVFGEEHRKRSELGCFAALLISGAFSGLRLLAQERLEFHEVLMIFGSACTLAALAIVLPFHTRSAKFGRAMADAISALVIITLLLFFYSDHVFLLISGTVGLLFFFGCIIVFDSWFDPRKFRRGDEVHA